MIDAPSSPITDGLNEAQRDAVLHGSPGSGASGPLIVLAGPGTGKTRVIIHRIARIIRDGARPESVLAVTFTTKAAAQLRERLAGLVGGDVASRVRAQTFHSLGLALLRRHGRAIGLPPVPPGAGILDSAQRLRLLREAILSQNLFRDRRAAGVDAIAATVQSAMDELALRAIEPEQCREFLATWRARIAEGKDSRGRDADDIGLKAESARLEEFVQITTAYDWCRRECRCRGWLGFDDLITLPIRLLRESPKAAAIIRADFRHALVDEFQDVNAAQIEFLRQLFPPAPEGEPGPDLCIVGDDDQAIYGFRGADDRAFQRFDRTWPGSRRILLTENYRSEPCIIAAANRVISLAQHRFAADKLVERARNLAADPPAPGAAVECVELARDSEDGAAVATAILLARAASDNPPAWSSFAVVCRNNGDITRILADLELEGIPARGSYGEALNADQGVQDVLAWISLLVNPAESWPVRRLLTRPPLAADPLAAMDLEKYYRARSRGDGENGQRPSFLAWLAGNVAEDSPIHAPVRRLLDLHARLAEIAASTAAHEAIEQIVMLTDAAHADLLPARQRARRISALLALVRMARLCGPKLDQPRDLREFWRYWQDLDDDDRSLRSVGGIEDHIESENAGNDDPHAAPAVTVITAHKAKGLEWDTVFVPRVSPMHGYGKSGRRDECPIPEGLLDEDDPAIAARQPAEERRIFYVACTRAQRRLVLLAKRNKSPSKSTHYFEEFTRNPDGQGLVTIRDVEDLRRDAASLGRESIDTSIDDGELGGDVLDRARLAVRLSAAEALERADRPDADHAAINAAAVRLSDAAARLAIISHIGAHRSVPAFAKANPAHAQFADSLLAAIRRSDAPTEDAPLPPLSLSYTAIDAYTRCPRCYWLRYIKSLPEVERHQSVLGSVVHTALERFYTAVREADAAGDDPPTIETLLRWGKEEFLSAWPTDTEIDAAELDQTLAQLEMAHLRLHNPSDQILEIERKVEWDYTLPADGDQPDSTHRFTAKLDRLDQITLPDGRPGFRIVDYKTGQDWKSLREPQPDNLQFGVYALALPHLLPDVDPADVVAEFWLLASGQRGIIPLSSLRLDKVEKKIHTAVRGILSGHFEANPDCKGDCRLLRAPLGGG